MRPFLETALLDIFPGERDLFLATDPQTYISSVASDVLPALAHYFLGIAPPSSIDAQLYRKHNFSVPRVDIAIEAVILIDKDDKSRSGFTWEAARAACDDLEVAYPQTDEEAIDLAADFLMSLRSSMQVSAQLLSVASCPMRTDHRHAISVVYRHIGRSATSPTDSIHLF